MITQIIFNNKKKILNNIIIIIRAIIILRHMYKLVNINLRPNNSYNNTK